MSEEFGDALDREVWSRSKSKRARDRTSSSRRPAAQRSDPGKPYTNLERSLELDPVPLPPPRSVLCLWGAAGAVAVLQAVVS